MLSYLLGRVALSPVAIDIDFRRQHARNSVAALYWHWLDGLWVIMFVLLVAKSS